MACLVPASLTIAPASTTLVALGCLAEEGQYRFAGDDVHLGPLAVADENGNIVRIIGR